MNSLLVLHAINISLLYFEEEIMKTFLANNIKLYENTSIEYINVFCLNVSTVYAISLKEKKKQTTDN